MYKFLELDDESVINRKLLVTCPSDPVLTYKPGSVNIIDFETGEMKRILSGPDFRGADKYKDGYVLSTHDKRFLLLDHEFHTRQDFTIDTSKFLHENNLELDTHGVKVYQDDFVFIVETVHDKIGIYDIRNFNRIDEISLFEFDKEMARYEIVNQLCQLPALLDQHHINDIDIKGNTLYISLFHDKDNFREKIKNSQRLNGVILEYDIPSRKLINTIMSDLQMPHTVRAIGEDVLCCNSYECSLMKNNESIAQFNGFIRGLDFDGRFYYIGQSEMRHLNRMSVKPGNHVSLDCGIFIYDTESQGSRFLPILGNSQVYTVLCI